MGPSICIANGSTGAKTVGVTAGASAPEILVQGVIAQLREWGGEVVEELKGREEHVIFALPRTLARGAQAGRQPFVGELGGLRWRALFIRAAIAQLVEQRIRNAWVPSSNPGCGTIFPRI